MGALIRSVGGGVLLLLVLELVLRLLPVSSATRTGYHIDPLILTYPPGHQWTVATGWDLRNAHRLQSNNLGFVSRIDYVRDEQAIGLVGDSYVEASMLDEADRPAAQLAAALGGRRPVYAFGGPGSALLDYAERIRLAHERLGVRDFVVMLESGDVRQSLCGSGNIHGPCLDRATLQPRTELQPPPSPAKRVLRHSALAQYLFSQLKLDPSRLLQQAFASANPEQAAAQAAAAEAPATVAPETEAQAAARETSVRAVTDAFFARIEPLKLNRLVIVASGRRSASALAAGDASLTAIHRERIAFQQLAAGRGAVVVDTEAIYRQHWAGSTLSLAVGPYDAHLNALGVGLLMRAAARELP
ncbi:hypothetical protein [Pseudorhodoferax sp.]|uniref:hypothetical protein n=1 Tax=Pseudorhodoferax sp. TaxID=1993553 RepID=UPI002DD63160|nr:hypothetical protein [Pseudorhodoferax sp.]